MPNLVNQMVVRELTEQFTDAEGMVLVSFAGLTVAETEALRGKLAEVGARFRMVRNKLARRVLAERGVELAADALKGNTAIAYGSTEAAIGAAKVFSERETKRAGKVKFQAGLLEGQVLDAASAASLADIPSRDALNAQLLGVLSGPARSLVVVLAGLPSGLARVVSARADQLEGGS